MTVAFQGGTIALNVNKLGVQGIDASDFKFAP